MMEVKMIERNQCVVSGARDLEFLFGFESFPVYMGCVEEPRSEDISVPMKWYISAKSGCIQLDPLVPTEILYQNNHAESIGKVFASHHQEFADFISRFKPLKIFEIGGAHGILSATYKKIVNNAEWTILEPSPNLIDNIDVRLIKGFFDESFHLDWDFDAVVHSHVFEHMHSPSGFLNTLNKFVPEGGHHIFSVPNMVPQLKNYFLSCLDFEHTYFLSERFIEYYMEKYGFEIIDKKYYLEDHSIFYATRRTSRVKTTDLPQDYESNKALFKDYIQHYYDEVGRINSLIDKSSHPVYLFGAHIFSQYLIAFGLKTNKITTILDNSTLKRGKRLYGTDFTVSSPDILRNKGKASVILKAGMYNKEIMEDIIANINPEVEFWL